MKIDRLRIEHMKNPMGIDIRFPLISWTLKKEDETDGSKQVAFSIEAKGHLGTEWDSGQVRSDLMQFRIPTEFLSREQVKISVSVTDEKGNKDTAHTSFETGLNKSDWKALWINPELQLPDSDEMRPASYIRKKFSLSEKDNGDFARLYATAHGIYNIYINGRRLEGNVLSPGTSEYHKILQYQTYDITEYLRVGENEISAVIGNGWWRGTVTYDGIKNGFGKGVAFLAQIEYDGKILCITDESWEASQEGPLLDTDLMQGEVYDAGKENIAAEKWHKVKKESFGYDSLEASNCPLVKEHETFKPVLIHTPNGEAVLDFGQNIAGYIGFDIDAEAGRKYQFIHGETLDGNGNFTIENFQSMNYRAEQRIVYITKKGKNIYKATNTFMGFRYVKVEGMKEINPDAFTAYAVYSDLEETFKFSCGHPLADKLVKNAVWSLKGNLVDIPTDCPTREKSGFTGDLVTYIHTFQYLMNTGPIIGKFIKNQAASQYEDGCVKEIVADPRKRWIMDGSAGWCDSFEILPDKTAEWYNDTYLFEKYYEAIKKWVDFLIDRAASSTREEHMDNPYKECLDDAGIHWGEWLEPGFDFENYLENIMKNGEPEVGTAYLSYSCRILAKYAKMFGKTEEADYYGEKSKRAAKAYRYMFTDEGKIYSKHMCRYIRPIVLELLDEDEKKRAADDLNELVKENGYHLNTGFLTTHELCRILSDYGYIKTAYNLLLQEEQPGWLYSVKNGMTSIPENWNPFRADGSMNGSFNHYSYGSVTGWLFDTAAGIRLKNGELTIMPKPDERLGYLKAECDTPVGKVKSEWKYEDDKIYFHFELPGNKEALVKLPDGKEKRVSAGVHDFVISA